MRGGWLFLVAAFLLAGAPSTAVSQTDPTAIARQVELQLPEQLCGFFRRVLAPHPQGAGLLASYASADGAWIDVFIVPVQRQLEEDFEDSVRVTMRLHPGLSEVGTFAAPPGVAGARGRVLSGRREGRPLLTGVLMWHRADWRIKVLASALSIQDGPAWAGVECAIRALGAAPATI